MLLWSYHSEFAENSALQFVPKASNPMGTDCKVELFGMQFQNPETARFNDGDNYGL
jgi:hypothetical protein